MDAGTFEELGKLGAAAAEEAQSAATLSGQGTIGKHQDISATP